MSRLSSAFGSLLSAALTIIVVAESPAEIMGETVTEVSSPFVAEAAPQTPQGFVVSYYGGSYGNYASEPMRSYTPSTFNQGFHPDNLSSARAGLARAHAFSSNLYRRESKGTPIYRITLY